MIDVVIPLFNKQSKIGRCLKSVISQTVLPNKIIVIDDGSSDLSRFNVEQALRDYSGKYEIVTTNNQGVSSARNLGVTLAESGYVAFLDADDFWDDGFIESAEKALGSVSSEGVGLIAFFHRIKKGKRIFVPNQGVSKDFSGILKSYSRAAKCGSPVNSSKVIVKKSILQEVGGFPEGNGLTEDLYLWMRLSKVCEFYISNEILVTVDKGADESRPSRLNMTPYILLHYLVDAKHLQSLDRDDIFYLRHVYVVQSLYSVLYGNFDQSKLRIAVGRQTFPLVSKCLYFTALVVFKIKSLRKSFK